MQPAQPIATLWADNPDVAQTLPLLFAHVGIPVTVVTTAEALLRAAERACTGAFLVVDCSTAPRA